ncbi:MAG: UDP-N-acetylmuramoyl-tripeptide--D-alanyl-D-alanine ligase [Leptospiraceae bacterium]|nr:UDP-N-acetylmuramoyl-tripeptide--D-alanyl-D-alanine ligase [Leptospiraceae bacterium]MDW7976584.1 UDP-N-acetylmuramoyl-tripeptide--D-alanyl-D-alanine ligase [Leptospiraceae bacterium]
MFFLTEKQKKLFFEVFSYNKEKKGFEVYNENLSIPKIEFDTRKIQTDDCFFIALQSQRDGHDFVMDAVKKKVKGIIINEAKKNEILDQIQKNNPDYELYVIIVEDTLSFLHKMAEIQRNEFLGLVIGVLGSNGKTSTKDFLCELLNSLQPTFCSKESFNNHIGVPLTILNKPNEAKIIIVEMGMNHKGEIKFLTSLTKPDVFCIPSIGREHMAFFSSLEEVARAELEFLDFLNENHYVFYPSGAPLKEELLVAQKQKNFTLIFFELSTKENGFEYESKLQEKVLLAKGLFSKNTIQWKNVKIKNQKLHHFGLYSNLFLSLLVYEFVFKTPLSSEVLEKLENLKPTSKHRFEIHQQKGITIIDDSYNANPDSFLSAIQSIVELFNPHRKKNVGCFIGHMAELGDFSEISHREIGRVLAENDFHLLGVCGNSDVLFLSDEYRKYKNHVVPYFESSELLAENLTNLNLPFDQYEILFIKGSRSAKMERITQKLLEVLQNV